MLINKIREAITREEVKEALQATYDLSQKLDDSNLQNTLILLLSRYNQNIKQQRNGLISADNFNQTNNQIKFALISTLDDIRLPEGFEFDLSPYFREPINEPRNLVPPPQNEPEELRILMLTANPFETAELQLREEHSHIQQRINNARNHRFKLDFHLGVTPSEFQDKIDDFKPHYLHFSGHGEEKRTLATGNTTRAVGRAGTRPATPITTSGIILMDENRRGSQFVSTEVLGLMFKFIARDPSIPLHTVIFNACFSENQATAIAEHVEYVIGTSSSIGDEAAVNFASGFYNGLARTNDIMQAIQKGTIAAMIKQESKDIFKLYHNGEEIDFLA